MSMSFNKVILAGNISWGVDLRFTGDGIPVASFGLAVNNPRSTQEDAVDFFEVTAWRDLGETIANYKQVGDEVLVEGRLTYSEWKAQDGSKRSKVTVTAQNVQFGRQAGNGNASGQQQQKATETPQRSSNRRTNRQAAEKAQSQTRQGGGRGRGGRRQQKDDFEEDFEDIPF